MTDPIQRQDVSKGSAMPERGTPTQGRDQRISLVPFLLILLLIAIWFVWGPVANVRKNHNQNAPLTVEPAVWSGPIGGRVEFVITRAEGGEREVVSSQAVTLVGNPKVLSMSSGCAGHALAPGRSDVTFSVGELQATAKVEVSPRTMPTRLMIEPVSVELGVGTTAQLKLYGQYEDGRKVDLTDDVEWLSDDKGFIVHKGRVEALQAGNGKIQARYRSHESLEAQEADCSANATDQEYSSLRLTLDPTILTSKTNAQAHVTVATKSGREFSVDDSGELSFELNPAGAATIVGTQVTPEFGGELTVTARFRSLAASVTTRVARQDHRPLAVSPSSLDLKVGELAQLDICTTDLTKIRITSKNPEIAEVRFDNQITGRQAGETVLEVTDASGTIFVPTTVKNAEWQSIVIEPPHMGIRPLDKVALRVYGIPGGANRIQLDGEQMNWVRLPRPGFVLFNRHTQELLGARTTEDGSERVTARFKTLEASADISVCSPRRMLASIADAASQKDTPPLTATNRSHRTGVSAGQTVVSPEHVTLQIGELARVGHEITILQGGIDQSDSCEVNPISSNVVSYDPDSRVLRALSAGLTTVVVVNRDEMVTIPIEVQPERVLDPDSEIVIEPTARKLAVGERTGLQAFVITRDGRRLPVSAAFHSSGPDIAIVSGSAIQGLSQGDVVVEATVPGISQSCQATFAVRSEAIEKLIVRPAQLNLAVGQRSRFCIYGVTKNGQVELGDDANLSFAVSDADGTKIDLSPGSRSILGLRPGNASIMVRWMNMEHILPIGIHFDFLNDVVAKPTTFVLPTAFGDAFIPERSSVEFVLLAIRTGRLEVLNSDKGATLKTADPVVADVLGSKSMVRGLTTGKTLVTTRYGSHAADVQLTVVPPDSTTDSTPNPSYLRFADNPIQMDSTDSGRPLRIVTVYTDGTEREVQNLVTMLAEDSSDVVQIEQQSIGPVVVPQKNGQAKIVASLGELKTRIPLLVQVGPLVPRKQELRLHPSSFHLAVGETKRFAFAEVLPASGGSPVRVPYTVTTNPNRFIEIQPDGSIRALAPGNAVVTVAANDAEGKYSGLVASAPIEVGDLRQGVSRAEDVSAASRPDLILTGPSETSVGAEVAMHIESVNNGQWADATNSAQLILMSGDEQLASIRPSNVIHANEPGVVRVYAHLNGVISLPLELRIQPISTFRKLEIEIAQNRMIVGEQRSFKLWGYPVDGAARQDLTRLVGGDSSDIANPVLTIQSQPDTGHIIFEDGPGRLTARAVGRITIQASVGDVKSEPITLDAIATNQTPERLVVLPRELKMRCGQETPEIEGQIQLVGDPTLRTIDPATLQISSTVVETLRPSAQSNAFIAVRPGKAGVQVRYKELETTIPVTVLSNAFQSITCRDQEFDRTSFRVGLTVTSATADIEYQYRCTLPGKSKNTDGEEWIRAKNEGKSLRAELQSPPMPLSITHGIVMVEARSVLSGEVERRPFAFRLGTLTLPEPAK